jgi:aspartyl-tRNA(Asn)/glutamyl-tRNA(Gln) amidotransferase subunit A
MTARIGSTGKLSASELSRLLSRRELSAGELVSDFLEAHQRLNPLLNAIVAIDPEDARRQAVQSDARAASGRRLGALDGIPVTVKDNIFVEGFPATWGSRLYEDFRPACDDVAIARLRAAGAIVVAKTNTPEFALAAYTDNLLFGPTRNPWHTDLTPGGSSGGAVAALAAGMVPLAVGTDAGGSIRRPASYAGVVGFRPSTGRIPRVFGFPALAADFQVVAPAARSVDDAYLLFRTMAGHDSRDLTSLAFADDPLPAEPTTVPLPRSRIRCVLGVGDAPVDPGVLASVRGAARTLEALGHAVDEGPPPYDLAAVERIWATVSSAGLARVVMRHHAWQDTVHPASRAVAERGIGVSAAQYIEAMDAVQALRASMATFFDATDFLLTPTSASLPWPVGQPYPEQIDGRDAGPRGAALFATFVNAAALPAVSLPVDPTPDGIPVGMQLVARFGADVSLLRLAREFEQAAPWSARSPAIT